MLTSSCSDRGVPDSESMQYGDNWHEEFESESEKGGDIVTLSGFFSTFSTRRIDSGVVRRRVTTQCSGSHGSAS